MDVQRLVVEEAQSVLTIDFHPGLTVAYHENPAVRARFLVQLVDSLGPSHSGVHLEITDNAHQQGSEQHGSPRHLAIFRPYGSPHRAVDIDRGVDVSSQFGSHPRGIDLLGRLGLDPGSSLRRMRLAADQIDRGVEPDTEEHRQARRLAGVEAECLWPAAERAVSTALALSGAQGELPVSAEEIADFLSVQAQHDVVVAAERSHRRNRRLGGGLAVFCAVLGALLLIFDARTDDRGFTGRTLLVLGATATGLVLYDTGRARRARGTESALLAARGVVSYEDYRRSVGALADVERRRRLQDAVAADTEARAAWRSVAGDCSPTWALEQRDTVDRLARQRSCLASSGAAHLATAEGSVSRSARALADKVVELREISLGGETLPVLLDEPFVGREPAEVEQLLDTVLRLSHQHQTVLVTGDPLIRSWAGAREGEGTAAVVRLTRGSPEIGSI